MGLMNFAQGEFIMVPAYVLYLLAGVPFGLAAAAALAVGIGLALGAERIAFRPVRDADLSAQLVTSLALATILQSVVMAAIDTRSQSVATPSGLSESSTILGLAVPNLELVSLALGAATLGALSWILFRSRVGLEMRAAAENFEMARLLGVRANRVLSVAFAISGALAALAGILLVTQTGQVSPTMGLTPVVIGFVAVTIGGFGRIGGAVLGGVLLGALSSLLGAYLPDGLQPFRDAIVFSLPVLILIFRPEGLLVRPGGAARI